MTNILAIETSTDNCSVSVSKGSETFNFHEFIPKKHTERLLEVITNILEESELNYEDLNAVSVGTGPGSYTGIRLSCAVAQGIAFAHGLKGITLSSLELLALEVYKRTSANTVVSLLETSSNQVYVGESSFNSGDIESTFSLIDIDSFQVENYPVETHFVGQGCSLFSDIKDSLPEEFPRASSLIGITNLRISKDQLVEPEKFLPIYLNNEDSWKKIK